MSNEEFPDGDVIGEKVRDEINPSEEFDDDVMSELEDFRDNIYEGLDQMLNDDRSPVWQIIREGRNDELLRCVGVLDRVISNMEKSAYMVRNLSDSNEFSERYSIPSEFKNDVNSLQRMIQEGETKAALMRVEDVVDDFKRYRAVAVKTANKATAEISKFFYMIDELRVVQSIIRDVRFTLQEDKALMLTDKDYVDVSEIVYKLLVQEIMENNEDVEIPLDPDSLDADIGEFMDGLKRKSVTYKERSWEERQKDLIEDWFSEEFSKERSDLTEDEIDEMKSKFGSETVEEWLGGTIE